MRGPGEGAGWEGLWVVQDVVSSRWIDNTMVPEVYQVTSVYVLLYVGM